MHAIRLRQPWHAQWCFSELHAPDATANLPLSSQPPSAGFPHRTACYRRSFNRPTGLIPSQVVAIVLRQVGVREGGVKNQRGASGHVGAIKLNAQTLVLIDKGDRIEAEISQQLEPFNQLEIVCQLSDSNPTQPPDLTDLYEISIEIY